MAGACRIGDQNNAGGTIMDGASSVFINGQPAGLVGSTLTPHAPFHRKSHPPHKSAKITSGSESVLVDGKPIAKIGSSNSCGHSMVQGSSDVNVP